MSVVNLLSSLREKTTEESQNDGSNSEGHEDSGSSGGGADPAVLAVGPARRPLTYTRDELMRLRNSPLVKRNLENAFAGCEALSLVLKKRSDSPNEEDRGARGDAPNENHKGVYGRERERERERERRSADPRERVRKESEPCGGGGGGGGIVLSPQRRSFTSGCGAPASAAAAPPPHLARTRPESPLPTAATQPPPPKTDQVGRRIGSGRIMVRDVGAAGWGEEGEFRSSEPYRPPHRDRELRDDRNHNARPPVDRFERRSFSRDSYSSDIKRERDDRFNNEKTRDRDDNRRSGGRYSQRRYEKEDEPEWFSAGPTSQLETIELRGFDEPTKKSIVASNNNNNKENEKWNHVSGSRSPVSERWRDTSSPVAPTPTPTDTISTNNDKDSGIESKTDEPQNNDNDQPEFNLDEFLKFDSIPDVLTNGGGESEGGSRFSRWFHRESPTNDSKHYERLLNNMVDDLDKPNHVEAPPIETPHVFAPISPISSMSGMTGMSGMSGMPGLAGMGGMAAPPRPHPHPPSLLDLLLRANEPRQDVNSVGGGKIHSLEELEARLRPQHNAQAQHSVPDHDLTAFKRLLAQVSGGHAVPAASEPPPRHHLPPQPQLQAQPQPQPQPQTAPQTQPQPQPMTLLQMLNKSMEQQQKAHQQQHQQQQPHIPQELLYKLLQVQRQQQHQVGGDVGGVGVGVGVGGLGVMGPSAADRELLQRPEAQAIVHGLKAGEITVQHLMQQLGNPGLQSRHREVLLTILRLHQQQRQQIGGSPLPGGVGVGAGAGGAPHLVVPPHHQPLRLSPLPHQAFCVSPIMATSPNTLTVHHPGVPARIPSPRELAAHTQSIMQNALIKKKLEEQRENYRRRHEMQQQTKQSTPISFTPTSVLRKMTAEKDGDGANGKQQWTQPSKTPQGRPIVKGNQSGVVPPMGYAPSPTEYQQHYLNQQQQQMAGGVRPFSHTQQRQQLPNSYNNMNNMNRGMAGGTTLHQLLVQSHQRSLNEMGSGGGNGGGGAGGDNQLARWFSPELLARASAGKLPSVHVPNALSLEDLERHHYHHQSPAPPVRN